MEKQYCRVGTSTSMTAGHSAVSILENRYQNFTELAANVKYRNTRMGDFFEQKASKVKKVLDSLG